MDESWTSAKMLETIAQVATIIGAIFAGLSFKLTRNQVRRNSGTARSSSCQAKVSNERAISEARARDGTKKDSKPSNGAAALCFTTVGFLLIQLYTLMVSLAFYVFGFQARHNGLSYLIVNYPERYWAETVAEAIMMAVGTVVLFYTIELFRQGKLEEWLMNFVLAVGLPLLFIRSPLGSSYFHYWGELFGLR